MTSASLPRGTSLVVWTHVEFLPGGFERFNVFDQPRMSYGRPKATISKAHGGTCLIFILADTLRRCYEAADASAVSRGSIPRILASQTFRDDYSSIRRSCPPEAHLLQPQSAPNDVL